MIYLDTTTRKLQLVLAGAKTTNHLKISVSYYDVINQTKEDNSEYRGSQQVATSNNTTDVDICAAPLHVGTIRNIRNITIYNADTVNATVTVKLDDGGTETIYITHVLTTTQSLIYEDGAGWMVI